MNRDQTSEPSWRRSRVRDAVTAAAIVAVVGALAGGSVLAGAVGAAFGRDAAVSSASVLGDGQARADRLPATFPADQHGTGGVDAATARLLSTQAGSRYWIALDRASNVCLLVQSTTVAQETAASCVTAADLETHGAALQVESARWQLDAVLIPDSVDEASVSGPWSAVAENLVVVTDPSPATTPLELQREPGEPGAPLTLGADSLSSGG